MVKYVVVDEYLGEIIKDVESTNGKEIYAEEVLEVMREEDWYIPGRHYLYLKVGRQDDDVPDGRF